MAYIWQVKAKKEMDQVLDLEWEFPERKTIFGRKLQKLKIVLNSETISVSHFVMRTCERFRWKV